MRFILIRHAQSENNRRFAKTPDAVPDADPALSALGRRQALALAGDARHLPWTPTHLYSSLMIRAVATAAPLADALDLPVLGHEQLFEVGGPHTVTPLGERVPHPGAGRDALAALTPRLVLPESVDADGWYRRPVETEADAHTRAHAVVESLRARHRPGDVVVLMGHAWFAAKLLRVLLGGLDHVWFSQHNTGLTVVSDAEPGLPVPLEVDCVNDSRHLPRDWVT